MEKFIFFAKRSVNKSKEKKSFFIGILFIFLAAINIPKNRQINIDYAKVHFYVKKIHILGEII
ncbi:MAG TPA: hypothetical protein CFH84_06385 [Sulfurimonas sp. UBA12504]|nr:MAG: hypothetical protein A2019_00395 [Sulfurimonas sp. GWF2_37_8]DAB30007.1 MAG TPA: hypothetical protein CFH84_06385 [Sulfurimonas sp. UBA12504]